MTNYEKYRGKCKEFVDNAILENPKLTAVRGFYFCPFENREYQHWWCKDENGNIIDPTEKQFLSCGKGIYREFDGIIECSECGKEITEEDADIEGRYAFCSYSCHMKFVGLSEFIR